MATSSSQQTLDYVKTRPAKLRQHRGEPGTSAPDEVSTVTWPRDLDADGEVVTSGWGADPAECV